MISSCLGAGQSERETRANPRETPPETHRPNTVNHRINKPAPPPTISTTRTRGGTTVPIFGTTLDGKRFVAIRVVSHSTGAHQKSVEGRTECPIRVRMPSPNESVSAGIIVLEQFRLDKLKKAAMMFNFRSVFPFDPFKGNHLLNNPE